MKNENILKLAEVYFTKTADAATIAKLENEARSSVTAPERLKWLANINNHRSASVVREVASNKKTPVEVIKWLADVKNTKDIGVLKSVAANESAPPDVLNFLANYNNSRYAWVPINVIRNDSASPEAIHIAVATTPHSADGLNDGVLYEVLDEQNILPQTITLIANSEYVKNKNSQLAEHMAVKIIHHPNTPFDLRQRIFNYFPEVRNRVRPEMIQKLTSEYYPVQ